MTNDLISRQATMFQFPIWVRKRSLHDFPKGRFRLVSIPYMGKEVEFQSAAMPMPKERFQFPIWVRKAAIV